MNAHRDCRGLSGRLSGTDDALAALRMTVAECRDANLSVHRAALALCRVPPEIGAELASRLADAVLALRYVAEVCERAVVKVAGD